MVLGGNFLEGAFWDGLVLVSLGSRFLKEKQFALQILQVWGLRWASGCCRFIPTLTKNILGKCSKGLGGGVSGKDFC